jgi:hypothetical protein
MDDMILHYKDTLYTNESNVIYSTILVLLFIYSTIPF